MVSLSGSYRQQSLSNPRLTYEDARGTRAADGSENRGRLANNFRLFRPRLSVYPALHGNLGRHWLSCGCMQWTMADKDDLARTSADDPPAVLKTAGLASAVVHQRPLKFDC